jgi:outer membrane protein
MSPTVVVAAVALAMTRVAAADGVHELSLAEAVHTAIATDAELYIAREDARDAEDGIALARAAFLPRLSGEVSAARAEQPPSATSFRAVDSSAAATIGVAGRLETGLTYKVTAGVVRQDHEDPFSTVYDAATTTKVHAEVVQPLWRGAFAAARQPLVVASLRRNRGAQELRAQVERAVGAVQTAYWNLVRARAEREARASALSIAREQVEESRGLRRLGTGSDLDVAEADAGVSRRQQELLRAEQDVVNADGRLFQALGVRPGDRGWSAGEAIAPTDAPQIATRPVDVEAQLALALAHRAEVLAAQAQTAAELAELAVTDDQRRTALDVVVAAGTTGFGGSLVLDYATAGVNGTGLTPPYRTDPAYDGGLGTSLQNTLGRDLDVLVGLRLDIPLGRHEGEVRHAIQQRAVSRARLGVRAILARVESEVRTAVAGLAVSVQLVQATDHTVALSEKLLEGMRKRFRAGASTSFDVLRVSEALTQARIEAARARADYEGDQTRLATATGTLLDSAGITINSLGPPPR